MPASVSRCSPMTASSVAGPARSFACASLALSCTAGTISSATIARPMPPVNSGRRMTKCDQRHQKPRSSSVPSTIRFGITRTELMRGPSSASIAGRNVIAAHTETIGIKRPPIPIERITGMGRSTIEKSPMATVEPDTITARPACVIVSTSAVSVSAPWRNSSRKRKIMSSA